MNANRNKSKLLELALKIITAKLTTGSEREQITTQMAIVDSMIIEKIENALGKVHGLANFLEFIKIRRGATYCKKPEEILGKHFEKVAQAGEQLIEVARIAYNAQTADKIATLKGKAAR